MCETLTGGSAADTITLGSQALNSSIDLGVGSDTLNFGSFANTATVSNVETITATGTNVDTITLGTALVGGSIDLGAGVDTVNLANGTNTVTISNVESITGGSGVDTITVSGTTGATIRGGGGADVVTGGTGADTFVFDHANGTDTMKINNMGTGSDTIALDNNAFSVGGPLSNGVNISSGTDATASSPLGQAGFFYDTDDGKLYYSANGDFSGGGTLVGTITTNGSTAWTFDITKLSLV